MGLVSNIAAMASSTLIIAIIAYCGVSANDTFNPPELNLLDDILLGSNSSTEDNNVTGDEYWSTNSSDTERGPKCVLGDEICHLLRGNLTTEDTNGVDDDSWPTNSSDDERQPKCVTEETECAYILKDCANEDGGCDSLEDGGDDEYKPCNVTKLKEYLDCVFKNETAGLDRQQRFYGFGDVNSTFGHCNFTELLKYINSSSDEDNELETDDRSGRFYGFGDENSTVWGHCDLKGLVEKYLNSSDAEDYNLTSLEEAVRGARFYGFGEPDSDFTSCNFSKLSEGNNYTDGFGNYFHEADNELSDERDSRSVRLSRQSSGPNFQCNLTAVLELLELACNTSLQYVNNTDCPCGSESSSPRDISSEGAASTEFTPPELSPGLDLYLTSNDFGGNLEPSDDDHRFTLLKSDTVAQEGSSSGTRCNMTFLLEILQILCDTSFRFLDDEGNICSCESDGSEREFRQLGEDFNSTEECYHEESTTEVSASTEYIPAELEVTDRAPQPSGSVKGGIEARALDQDDQKRFHINAQPLFADNVDPEFFANRPECPKTRSCPAWLIQKSRQHRCNSDSDCEVPQRCCLHDNCRLGCISPLPIPLRRPSQNPRD